jgi:hypothetical protein
LTGKPKPKSNAKRRGSILPDAGETRGAVALTIAWMLTCMSTAAATLIVVGTRLLLAAVPAAARDAHPLTTIGGVILLVAVTTGGLCLLLTPLVYRARRSSPPQPITVAAILIGVAPLALMVVLALR